MNYAELAVMQASRAKTFSAAQTDAMAAYCQAEHDLKELQVENAELRKLLVDFRDAMWDGGEWTEPFDERMRELGIEVDA